MPSNAKEKPIIFSAPMVRAILAGAKTMTRRVVKPQPHANISGFEFLSTCFKPMWSGDGSEMKQSDFFKLNECRKCPFGGVGNRLWVREKWGFIDFEKGEDFNAAESAIAYWASGELIPIANRWRSPIHMSRAFSRITLEITGVRVERLQDISEEDAKAEGAYPIDLYDPSENYYPPGTYSYREGFAELWESINGPGSWAANPWVWCVTFRPAKEATQ